ncbi:MAG: radical SAM protein [Candidatus Hydrogenedens sp.]|nr:radical SAM protein [Candidatus Hydrogenedens sp.]
MNIITPIKTGVKVANIIWSRWRESIPYYLPILIAFVTYRCNLRCVMCGLCELREIYNPKELNTEEWKNVIHSAKKLGTMIISISGGEPLLRKDLEEIIACADKNNISTHLCTNGTLIDKSRAQSLKEAGVKTISFSLDSASEEVHDSIRGKGQFKRTMEGILWIHKIAPEIRTSINVVITRKNFRGMSNLVKLAKEAGVHQIKFAPVHKNLLHRFKREDSWTEYFFDANDIKELEEELKQTQALCKQEKILTTSDNFYKGIPRTFIQPNKFTCYAGFLDCIITPEGNIGACCDIESTLSVRNKSLEDIWHSQEFHQYRMQVCRCKKYCWDTTNTEFSLRLNVKTLFSELPTLLKEFLFYLK